MAAVLKAVADTLSHHFETSVFKWKDPRFWDPAISWQYAKYLKFTKYKLDAWHLANSGMITCFILFGILFPYCFYSFWAGLIALVILGTGWNIVFNIFYNHILRRK